jgi:tRNA uridine 5-carboxymethylaminomethyl modification enzyme
MDLVAEIWPEMSSFPKNVVEQVEIVGRYSGYMDRQTADISAFRNDESLLIPDDIDFDLVGGLSNEIKSKFKSARPATLGAAARISGVTPAGLTALLGFVRKTAKSIV